MSEIIRREVAVQGIERHRHFRLSGAGYVEHSHAIGRREHEHLYARLGRVVLTWVDRQPSAWPMYQDERVRPSELVGLLLVVLVMSACVARVWPW